jgi:hypothetical protein
MDKRETNLYADGSDNANLVTVTCAHILRDSFGFGIPRIVLGLATRGYDCLCC